MVAEGVTKSSATNQREVSDALKSDVENYNLEAAISELTNIWTESADIYHQLKKAKFDYLVKTCELYSRIDFPSIMMEVCRKEVTQKIPNAKNIEKLEY